MLMAFMILNAFGITLNMMVLFSLILALGMLVDNGIVVVENTYRLMSEGKIRSVQPSKAWAKWPGHHRLHCYYRGCFLPPPVLE